MFLLLFSDWMDWKESAARTKQITIKHYLSRGYIIEWVNVWHYREIIPFYVAVYRALAAFEPKLTMMLLSCFHPLFAFLAPFAHDTTRAGLQHIIFL